MKKFAQQVKRDQEKHEGKHVFRLPSTSVKNRELIDMICFDRDKRGRATLIRARGNGHGHINGVTKLKLQQLGKQCGARVLLARVNGENEIAYEIIINIERKKYKGGMKEIQNDGLSEEIQDDGSTYRY